MDEKKENETQTELESSVDVGPVSDNQKTDRDSESPGDTQKDTESETANIAPESTNDLPEDGSGSETADGIKTEQKPFEIETTGQPVGEGSENAEAFEGQGAEKGGASGSDDASDGEDTATPRKRIDLIMIVRSPIQNQKKRIQPKKSKMILTMATRKKIILNNSQMALKGKPKTYPN